MVNLLAIKLYYGGGIAFIGIGSNICLCFLADLLSGFLIKVLTLPACIIKLIALNECNEFLCIKCSQHFP